MWWKPNRYPQIGWKGLVMRKCANETAEKVGRNGVDSTRMIYYEYLQKKGKGVEYTNLCFNKQDRNKYGDVILVGVDVLESVKENGDNCRCFEGCVTLPSISHHLSGSLVIFVSANAQSMPSVSISSSVSVIGEQCFFGCSSLLSITVPSSVRVISDGCFMGCVSLSLLTLPSRLKPITEYFLCVHSICHIKCIRSITNWSVTIYLCWLIPHIRQLTGWMGGIPLFIFPSFLEHSMVFEISNAGLLVLDNNAG